ncbi:hypothetical protein [Streptomyces sp. NPDC088789]|uniref:hypothetical protein n=1 Tax=Streptomyces sp. NPDC088789 TaxID=3365899 RepID=UPI0037F6A017
MSERTERPDGEAPEPLGGDERRRGEHPAPPPRDAHAAPDDGPVDGGSADEGPVDEGPVERRGRWRRLSGPEGRAHRPEDTSKQSHTGNGTVNDRLDDQGPQGLDSDELALRRLLHDAVQEIEPREGTLDHLRRAVPARRTRKRQAVVGMAAAALFIGTAVPALVHVSNSAGPGANPSIAGLGEEAQGGSSQGEESGNGSSASGGSTGGGQDTEAGGDKEKDGGDGSEPGDPPGTPSGGPADAAPAAASPCTAAQLGGGSASAAVPDSAGTVYGAFRISNVSEESCSVSGDGTVTPVAQGAADATKISVAQHTPGGAASDLPDTSVRAGQLVLLPGAAYEVRFAWVPSETCPVEGGNNGGDNGGPSPNPTPSQDPAVSGGSTTGDTGTGAQLLTGDGTADGSVQVSYTPEAGSPSVGVTVPDACAGTVYRTGVLAGS